MLALDEPTAALDVHHEMAIFELLRDLGRAGTTVLLVTHNLNLAARYADRLVLLDARAAWRRRATPGERADAASCVERVYRWPVRLVPHPGPGPDAGAPQVLPLAAGRRRPHPRPERPDPRRDIRRRPCVAALACLAALGAPPRWPRRSGPPPTRLPRYRLEGVPSPPPAPPPPAPTSPAASRWCSPAPTWSARRRRHRRRPAQRSAAVDVIEYPGLLSGVAVRGFRPQYSGINPRTLRARGRPPGGRHQPLHAGPVRAWSGSRCWGPGLRALRLQRDGRRGQPGDPRTPAATSAARAAPATAASARYRGAARPGRLAARPARLRPLPRRSTAAAATTASGAAAALGGDSLLKRLPDGRDGAAWREAGRRTPRVPFARVRDALGAPAARGRSSPGAGAWTGAAASSSATTCRTPATSTPPTTAAPSTTSRGAARSWRLRGEEGAHSLSAARLRRARRRRSYYDDARERPPTSPPHARPLVRRAAAGRPSASARTPSPRAWTTRRRSAALRLFSAPGCRRRPTRRTPDPLAGGLRESRAAPPRRAPGRHARRAGWTGVRLPRGRRAHSWRRSPRRPQARGVFNPSAGLLVTAVGRGCGCTPRRAAPSSTRTPSTWRATPRTPLGPRAPWRSPAATPRSGPRAAASWDAGVGLLRPRLGPRRGPHLLRTRRARPHRPAPHPLDGMQLTPAGDTVRASPPTGTPTARPSAGWRPTARWTWAPRRPRLSLRLFADATRVLRAEETTAGRRSRIRNVAGSRAAGGAEYDDRRRWPPASPAATSGSGATPTTATGPTRARSLPGLPGAGPLRRPPPGARRPRHLEVANLPDENYYEVRGYNLPGRALRLGLSLGS